MTKNSIGRQLAQVNNLIQRQILNSDINKGIENPTDKTISHTTACIISFLYDKKSENIYQKDIEREFQVRRSTVSKELSNMEQKGLIVRVAVENDRRLKKIELTEKSESIAKKLAPVKIALEDTITKGINDDELYAFSVTLEKIKKNLTQEV